MIGLPSIFKETYRADGALMEMHAQFQNLRAANMGRVERLKTYRKENAVSRDTRNDLDVRTQEDYGRRRGTANDQPKRHYLPIPLGKANTVKHSYRIAGAPFDMTVDQRDSSRAEAHRSDLMEKVAWVTYKHSRGETTIASGAWDGSELGSTVFDIYFDVEANVAKFRRIDPIGFFEVQGIDNPHDFECTYRVWEAPLATVKAQYADKLYQGMAIPVSQLVSNHKDPSGVDMVEIIQKTGKHRIDRWIGGGDEATTIPIYEFQHDYGFVPNVVIPNIGPYEDVWGWADYEFIRALAAYIPTLLGREADVLKASANGGMIEKGTGAAPQTIRNVIDSGGVLPSKRDGTVEPIEPPDMPSFHPTHADRTMDLFKMVGFTPDAAWGLPGSGSGSDRGLQLQPLLEYTGMKQMNWSAGMSRLYSMAFRIVEKKMTGQATLSGVTPNRRGGRSAFKFIFGPDAAKLKQEETDAAGFPSTIELPMSPKEVFDGDYEIRVAWRNRIDPEDPQYVMAEMNKFTQGAQSLETTLENLGVQAPEDEMRRIEKEAERFPWINNGLVSLIMAQIKGNQQGEGGGGSSPDLGAAVSGALGSMSGDAGASGALNTDAGIAAQGPDTSGVPYGGA